MNSVRSLISKLRPSGWPHWRTWPSYGAGRLGATFLELMDPGKSSLPHWLLLFVLCVVSTAFVESRLLTTPGVLLGSNTDAVYFHYPVRDFIHSWVQKGILPLWEPHIFNGLPLQTGLRPIINPQLLITLFTGNIQDELRASVFLHLFFCHFGAVVWLRSWRMSLLAAWFGSAAITFTGFQLSHLFAGHYDIMTNLAWVPWLLWSVRLALLYAGVGWSFLAIFFWSILMTCGHYHVIYLSLWYLAVEFLVTCAAGNWGSVSAWDFLHPWGRAAQSPAESRGLLIVRGLLRIGFLGVATGGLNCWQLLPTLETVSLSVRGAPSYLNAIEYGSPPWAWLSLLIPHLYQGTMELGSWCGWIVWEGQGFCGVVALLLVLCGLLRTPSRTWAPHVLVAVIAHWLALGDFAGLFKIYYKLDPLLGLFRVPSRFLWPATLATGWLVAQGAQSVFANSFDLGKWGKRVLLGLLGANLTIWAVSFYQEGSSQWWVWFVATVARSTNATGELPENPRALYGLTWTRYSNTVFLIGLFCYILFRLPLRARCASLVVLTMLELAQFSRVYQQVAPDQSLWLSPEVLMFIQGHPTADRFCCDPSLNWQNHFGAYGLSEVTGYENIMGSDYARQVLQELHMLPGSMITVYSNPYPCALHKVQSTRYYVQTVDYIKNPNHPDAARFANMTQISITDSPIFFYSDPEALPRAYFTPGARKMDHPGRGIRELEENWARTRYNVNLDGANLKALTDYSRHLGFGLSEFTQAIEDVAKVEDPQIRPNDVSIRCENRLPGVLVLTDSPWPGWRVLVDQRPAPMLSSEADLHRAVFLPPGKHQVQFYYWPDSLDEGIALTRRFAIGLTGIFFLLWLVSYLRLRLKR